MSIVIIDCGVGNLKSVEKAFQQAGSPAYVTRNPKDIKTAAGLVLPGVGAFDPAVKYLRNAGFEEEILQYIALDKPFLGICLGLQVLFKSSEEGKLKGLDIFKGKSVRFNFKGTGFKNLKIPHMGWNRLLVKQASPLLAGIPEGSMFYFVHSYTVVPDDPSIVLTETDYGTNFVSAVAKGNIFATQFHPEKSGEIGLKMLKNFVDICKKSKGGKGVV
ncbi:MAG: imidazole glycerol phosphate synthase subunit HisH [Candidatus Margulisbacteria bacterium]|nr:imidazole glycerol phosphate synthase subunit HisH [Candidatus Margulisiibacteriota bacterium]MBU1021651.1 imidazole glycerol phosphate synthase subunit HisH [Candidatus Margulisiibacteriota bacterium]MBU1728801.1 imidazole glycerol phosphate synthase subunit HisH [Candidatus Margulisiibacteriota bacterium]MBU1955767.1 imidazole glycerol phosphate synthase subunit HisH [Candidatus Margulisiibacteriota bacterium]